MRGVKPYLSSNIDPEINDKVFVLDTKSEWSKRSPKGTIGILEKINGRKCLVRVNVPLEFKEAFGRDTTTEWVGYDRLGYVE